ncbi:FixH family protein [Neorhizobium galegae]|uniref:Nitrogen fixation protein FixH n=2 Tax=Neorhizobium galegae TaxID=399 RepID=A0A068SVM7_NEOGA|nr:FixH family protein [Neorhizobium galegae]CDN50283.1 Nitrogen fixation protein FixH [Neorhizobium galegae bv. orientalis str. HAMBI 540]
MSTTKMNTIPAKTFVFTGWHMVGVLVLFFGTIISVNFYMAYNAVTSWSGLVAENTYVASQQFNGKAAEARTLTATGVTGRITTDGSDIRYEVFHPKNGPVAADTLTLKFKRPVGEHQDFELDLVPVAQGVFTATHEILPGHWIVDASAIRNGKRILHQAERIAVLRRAE